MVKVGRGERGGGEGGGFMWLGGGACLRSVVCFFFNWYGNQYPRDFDSMTSSLSESINVNSQLASRCRVALYVFLSLSSLMTLIQQSWALYLIVASYVLAVASILVMFFFRSRARKYQFELNTMIENNLKHPKLTMRSLPAVRTAPTMRGAVR